MSEPNSAAYSSSDSRAICRVEGKVRDPLRSKRGRSAVPVASFSFRSCWIKILQVRDVNLSVSQRCRRTPSLSSHCVNFTITPPWPIPCQYLYSPQKEKHH